MPRQRRRRRIDPEVYEEIRRRVLEGPFTNAADLYRDLTEKFPDKEISDRTVRYIVKELLPPDPSGNWAPGPDNDPHDDALILSTLAERPRRNKEQWAKRDWLAITNEHARWLVWVRTGWPDMDPIVALVLAAEYRQRRETGRDTRDLDAFLAFAPWRSLDAYREWDAAIKRGAVQEPPKYFGSWAAFHVMAREVNRQREGDERDGQAPQGQS